MHVSHCQVHELINNMVATLISTQFIATILIKAVALKYTSIFATMTPTCTLLIKN